VTKQLLVSSFALAVLVTAAPASAQTFKPRQPRPEWGIFASGVSKTEQRLVLTASFGGGYEDDLSTAPVAPPVDDQTPVYSGQFASAGASLKYSVDRKKVYGDAQFSAYGRNYGDMSDPFVGTYSADGNFSMAVGKKGSFRTSLWAGQYVYNLAPMGYSSGSGPQVPGDPGAFTTGETYRGLGSSANYENNFAGKFSAYGAYSYYLNDAYSSATANGQYASQSASAGLRYAIGKGLGVRAGYGVTVGGFGDEVDALDYRSRSLDFGLDYNKSLSPSRRSTLTFGTAMAGILDQSENIHYYFLGHANFSYEIGRSWTTYASVNRNADFFQTLGVPTINDSFSGGLSGLIGRHLTVDSGISYWRGSAIGNNEQVYDSTNAFGSARVALNRVLAITASYSYYRYIFSNSVNPPPGFVGQSNRQVFQVSLVAWAPLVTKAPQQSRSANASR
jgi:hypothetical protein